jgi:hypothetical protein
LGVSRECVSWLKHFYFKFVRFKPYPLRKALDFGKEPINDHGVSINYKEVSFSSKDYMFFFFKKAAVKGVMRM